MPALLLPNVPDALHRKLKTRAAQNRRSMVKEAIILLEKGLAPDRGEFSDLPQPFVGNFLISDEWLAQAKDEGRTAVMQRVRRGWPARHIPCAPSSVP
jgi:hypothetical protein